MEINGNIENSSSQMPIFEISKYGITVETQESVWRQMKEMGLKVPTINEIHYQEGTDNAATLTVESIVKGIVSDRQNKQTKGKNETAI